MARLYRRPERFSRLFDTPQPRARYVVVPVDEKAVRDKMEERERHAKKEADWLNQLPREETDGD